MSRKEGPIGSNPERESDMRRRDELAELGRSFKAAARVIVDLNTDLWRTAFAAKQPSQKGSKPEIGQYADNRVEVLRQDFEVDDRELGA